MPADVGTELASAAGAAVNNAAQAVSDGLAAGSGRGDGAVADTISHWPKLFGGGRGGRGGGGGDREH